MKRSDDIRFFLSMIKLNQSIQTAKHHQSDAGFSHASAGWSVRTGPPESWPLHEAGKTHRKRHLAGFETHVGVEDGIKH